MKIKTKKSVSAFSRTSLLNKDFQVIKKKFKFIIIKNENQNIQAKSLLEIRLRKKIIEKNTPNNKATFLYILLSSREYA